MKLEYIAWTDDVPPKAEDLRLNLTEDGYQVFHWRDEVGVSYGPHSHEHDESLWVVDGELIFNTGGRELRLGPGDRLMLPRGTVHTAHVGPHGATYLIGEKG